MLPPDDRAPSVGACVVLKNHVDGLWTVSDPELTFVGVRMGTRATLLRLPSGGLLVHSPIALTPALKSAVDALGTVEHVVAPNLFHHLHATDWTTAWPGSRLHANPKLARKRKDLPSFRSLSDDPDPDWGGALAPSFFAGFDVLGETAFFHESSGTLISADLVENFQTVPDHWWTRSYLKLAGIHGKPGVSRLIAAMFNDRRAARRSVEALLERGFDRLTVCHGEVVETGASDVFREAYAWLPGG